MARSISIRRASSGDLVSIPLLTNDSSQQVSAGYLCGRFGVTDVTLRNIVEEGTLKFMPSFVDVEDGGRYWHLHSHLKYLIEVRKNPTRVAFVHPGGVEVVLLSDSDDDPPPVIARPVALKPIKIEKLEGARVKIEPLVRCLDCLIVYQSSALDTLRDSSGGSEISRFIHEGNFWHEQVDCLPPDYNGNIVFKLPPLTCALSKGSRLQDMDRSKDCYIWTRIFPTTCNVQPKKTWDFGKVTCTGFVECRNNTCDYFQRKKKRNQKSWSGTPKEGGRHEAGMFIDQGGILCHFCGQIPFCVATYPAKLFYMYPHLTINVETCSQMSRLSIHVGSHNHSCQKVFSRSAEKAAQKAIKKKFEGNPLLTPAGLKNMTAGSFVKSLCESTGDISEIERTKLFESLKVVSTPQKFASLFRSIRKDQPGQGELDFLVWHQKNIHMPFLHRFQLLGQGSSTDRPHIFKMTSKGHGSGVNLLRQMQCGGPLEGAWVSFDVIKRLTKDWVTFNAHLYDHNYQALYTIFTCELMSEDAGAFEKAWRLMIEVATKNGLPELIIHGFIVDNAKAGWIVVRNVFFGGVSNPDRERFDAFHMYQSFHRHTVKGIPEDRHAEHRRLWNSMRDAPTFVEAYRISHEIEAWWQAGNCIPGKLCELQSWISWWVVRWRQWGTFI